MKTGGTRETEATSPAVTRPTNRGVGLQAPGRGMPAVAAPPSGGPIGAVFGPGTMPIQAYARPAAQPGSGPASAPEAATATSPLSLPLAYTQGTDIHVGPGQERHLPHEAWHVVQQTQGRVKPTLQLKGVAINDDDGLEREADAMGAAAMQGGTTSAGLSGWHARTDASAGLSGSHSTIQRVNIVVAMPDVKVEQAAAPDFVTGAGLPADMAVVNRAIALAKANDAILVPIDKAELGSLGDKDTLYVYGHGSGSAAGGQMTLTAKELAAKLKQRGLKAGKVIELTGCGSGTGYIEEVDKALRDAGIPCSTIRAAMDNATTDVHGQRYVLSSEARKKIITAQSGVKRPDNPFDLLDNKRYQDELRKAEGDVLSKAAVVSNGMTQTVSPLLMEPITPASNQVQVITNGVKKIQDPPDFLTG